METGYTSGNDNKYFKCRKAAVTYNEKLESREGAAEMLGMSPSTLAHYELNITKVVPPDAVTLMADLYRAPELKASYCANDCPIGKGEPLATGLCNMEIAALKIVKAFCCENVEDIAYKLVDIVGKGHIASEDLPDLAQMLVQLNNIAKIVSEVRLACQKVLAEGATDNDS